MWSSTMTFTRSSRLREKRMSRRICTRVGEPYHPYVGPHPSTRPTRGTPGRACLPGHPPRGARLRLPAGAPTQGREAAPACRGTHPGARGCACLPGHPPRGARNGATSPDGAARRHRPKGAIAVVSGPPAGGRLLAQFPAPLVRTRADMPGPRAPGGAPPPRRPATTKGREERRAQPTTGPVARQRQQQPHRAGDDGKHRRGQARSSAPSLAAGRCPQRPWCVPGQTGPAPAPRVWGVYPGRHAGVHPLLGVGACPLPEGSPGEAGGAYPLPEGASALATNVRRVGVTRAGRCSRCGVWRAHPRWQRGRC